MLIYLIEREHVRNDRGTRDLGPGEIFPDVNSKA